MAKRETIRALCVGWVCAAVGLVVTYVVPMPFLTQVLVVFISGAAPTLYFLNRD